MRFATIIQPLTLSRRFLTPRKVTPEDFQWLVSRPPVMVLSLELELASGQGHACVHPKTVSAEEAIGKEGG